MNSLTIKSFLVLWTTQFLLAAFFGFVGYKKAFAPMADLASYHAWVAALPPLVARTVGWSEMLCAIALVLPGVLRRGRRVIAISAAILCINQFCAIALHALRGELAGALLQNLMLILLLGFVWSAWEDAQLRKIRS